MNGYLSHIVSRTIGKQDLGSSLENLSLPAPAFAYRQRTTVQEKPGFSDTFDTETKAVPPAAGEQGIPVNDKPIFTDKNTGKPSAFYKRSFVHSDVANHMETGSRAKASGPPGIPGKMSSEKQSESSVSRKNIKPELGSKPFGDAETSPVRLQALPQEVFEEPNLQEVKPRQKSPVRPAKIIFPQKEGKDLKIPGNQPQLNVSAVRETSHTLPAELLQNSSKQENISPERPAAFDFADSPTRKTPSFITRSDPAQNTPFPFKVPPPGVHETSKLVIGKISVEIMPLPVPSVKTEARAATGRDHFPTSKPTSTRRFNLRFGLGQI